MKLGDDRGRVPFAVVGVLLLVTSATFTATVAQRPDGGADVAASEALDRGQATARSAVTTAVRAAARDAARDPVLEPADTPAGQQLDKWSPFRDSLRLRAYLETAAALEATATRVDGTRVTASVPPVENVSDVSTAIDRVRVNRTAPGRLHVTVRNVTVTVHRDGRTVARRHRNVTVPVSTSALQLHERTTRFQTRLDREATDGPGLGRRLTARLYAMAWARGHAFHTGAPITNVVANRHVEFAANGGMLAEQRAVFGHADPAGVRGLERGGQRVMLLDVLSVTPLRGQQWLQTVLGESPKSHITNATMGQAYEEYSGPAADSEMTVGVNATADHAFTGLLDGNGTNGTDGIRNRTYGVRASVLTRHVHAVDGELPDPDPPGENWSLAATTSDRTVTVSNVTGPEPLVPEGFRTHGNFARAVEIELVEHRRWTRGNDSKVTTVETHDVYHVGVTLAVEHAPSDRAPRRPIDHLHEQGGPIDGENLAGMPAAVEERFVADRGGRDAVARAIVNGSYGTRNATIRATQPPALDRWTYASVASLRDRVRNVTVTVERDRLATTANGPEKLKTVIQNRRAELVGAPEEYRSVADKTRVAIRAAYVERVVARLDARAEDVDTTQAEVHDALAEVDDVPSGHLQEVLAAREEVSEPSVGAIATGGPGERVDLRVDGTPSYLPLTAIPPGRTPRGVGSVHALVARNQNLFTVPYGDLTDELFSAFFGGAEKEVPYRSAARTLQSVRADAGETTDPSYQFVINRHRAQMAGVNGNIEEHAGALLADRTRLNESQAKTVLNVAVESYPSTTNRSTAIANGSMARTVADAAAALPETPSTHRFRDEMGVRARTIFRDVRAAHAVDRGTAKSAASAKQQAVKSEVKDIVANQVENRTKTLRQRYFANQSGIPAGLGVSPLPGAWYATLNVWTVDVEGEFARFAVRADNAGPTAVGGTTVYARDGGNVTLDVDGDGTPERLGHSSRVDFESGTTVVVVVPPGGRGVGDVDGNADERSPGWPEAGVGGDDDGIAPCTGWPYMPSCSTNSEQTSTG